MGRVPVPTPDPDPHPSMSPTSLPDQRPREAVWDYPRRPELVDAGVAGPVLVLAADGDTPPGEHAEVEAFVSALRRGRVTWIQGHDDLHAQQQDVVASEIVSFVEAS